MLQAGDLAPGFTLFDLEGQKHSLGALLENGPVLLAIYKISCPVCQLTMPFLERLASGALQIVSISQDEDGATIKFMNKFGLTMMTLLDREEDGYPVSNAFAITHVPSLFLIETDGTISRAVSGFSKSDIEAIAARANAVPFTAQDHVPEWKAG
jgi:peroxiredoxin